LEKTDINAEMLEAIKNDDLESVKGWVEKGANLHAKEEALRWAAGNGHLELVKRLLELGLIFTLATTKHSDWLQKKVI